MDTVLYIILVAVLIYIITGNNVDNVNNVGNVSNEEFRVEQSTRSIDDNYTIDEPRMAFVQVKFHNDYRDLITALENVIVNFRHSFNCDNGPIKFTEPPHKEVKHLVRDFIRLINDHIFYHGRNSRDVNSGWDEVTPDPTVKSGYDKYWEKLGVKQLYSDPFPRSPLELVKIACVEKYLAPTQTRYICKLAVKKMHVDDVALIRISFILSNNNKHNVNIDEASFDGYYTDSKYAGMRAFNDVDEYRSFNKEMEDNDMTDPVHVQKQVQDYYERLDNARAEHGGYLDELHQKYNEELPCLGEYNSYKMTRSIYDDMARNTYDECHGRNIYN